MSSINPMYSEFSPKDIIFNNDVQARLHEGVKAVHDAVGATMGPEGRLVMYENTQGIWPVVTKDGVSVADMIAFEDQAKNMGAQFVIQACNEQLRETGDGTTLTAVLSYKFYDSALGKVACGESVSTVVKELESLSESTVSELRKRSRCVDSVKGLQKIARVSINHDNDLGDAIATAVWKAGKYGMVTKERMFQEGYKIEKHDGYKLETGLQQKEFANDGISMIVENPYVLVTDKRIHDPKQLDNLVRQIHADVGNTEEKLKQGIINNFALIIVSPTIGLEVNRIMIRNIANQSPAFIAHVKPSSDMEPIKNRFILEDIAALTGATFISEESGLFIDKIGIQHLGRCKKITSRGKETFIEKNNSIDISKRVNVLESMKDDIVQNSFAEESLARLTGGMVVVRVGGKNFTDQNEISDRVDDCIRACKSAMEQGYIRGGGIELLDISKKLGWDDLSYPHQVISSNAGVESIDVDTKVIIDPSKVVIHAIKNATSVVKNMLRTRVMILAAKSSVPPKNSELEISLN